MKILIPILFLFYSISAWASDNGFNKSQDGNNEFLANYVDGKVEGWSVTRTDNSNYYIKYSEGLRTVGVIIKNNQVKIIFKQNNGNNVLGAIYLPDGRIFKGKFDLIAYDKLLDQKIYGVIVYPATFKEKAYYGRVEFWRGTEVDRDGFGVTIYEDNKIEPGDYEREFPGKSKKLNLERSLVKGVFTLGLSTAGQLKNRIIGQDKLIKEMKAIEDQVDNFLNNFNYKVEISNVDKSFPKNFKDKKNKSSNFEISEFKSLCTSFGYNEFNSDGTSSKEFKECLKETYYESQKLKLLQNGSVGIRDIPRSSENRKSIPNYTNSTKSKIDPFK